MKLFVGIILFSTGIIVAYLAQGTRPLIDYDFLLTWFGFLLVIDSIALRLSKISIFNNLRNFLNLAFASTFFWWFYEWCNLALRNWDYPTSDLYSNAEWGFFATLAFTTVIPNLMISTNIVSGVLKKFKTSFSGKTIPNNIAYLSIALGFVFFLLSIFQPVYFFPLIWFVVFLVLDPINSLKNRRSLIAELINKNYKVIIILCLGALLAGFFWETINLFITKWTYPITPWFWELPAPITTKYIQMPLAGFIGYIPFIFSAFAFVEFLNLKIRWFIKE